MKKIVVISLSSKAAPKKSAQLKIQEIKSTATHQKGAVAALPKAVSLKEFKLARPT